MKPVTIGNKVIGPGHPPFVVAEMSGNHNGSLSHALAIVDAAADCGADAIKLQTYTPDTMTLDIREGDFLVKDPASPWHGQSLYELYKRAHTPWEWHEPIFRRCQERGVLAFSTPFDETSVDFLESLGAPCFKIASQENTDLPLIERAAATGKPLIISTGMARVGELEETVRMARNAGCKDLVLLKCTSNYPALPTDSHLRTLPNMQNLFDVLVGLSDHTLGIGVAVASVAFGAALIEKHFTLSRADGGVDAEFSMEPEEFRMLVREAKNAWYAMGKVHYGPTTSEAPSLRYRRSLYVTKDLPAGATLTKDNVRAVRPGLGLPPKYLHSVIGRQTVKPVRRGTPLSWELLTGKEQR